MSVQLAKDGQGGVPMTEQAKDSFGLPVEAPATEQTQTATLTYTTSSPRSKGIHNGVRVPVLKDLNTKYGYSGGKTTCRFDIIETVTTVIKPGSYGPMGVSAQSLESPGRSSDSRRKGLMSRQPTYYSTLSTLSRQSDHSVLDKITPYQWTHKLKTSKDGDARDVLYRNTFCKTPQSIRYRTLKLPRISGDQRPWTVGGVTLEGTPDPNVHESGEYSKTITIIPQQPRPTVVRFHEYMKPATYASESKGLDVKRIPPFSTDSRLHMTRSGNLPLILQDSRKFSRKSERPMKFESSRHSYSRGNDNKTTLFSKRVPEAIRCAFDRDYSSADTFKEYLEGLQNATSANVAFLYTRDNARGTSESRRSIDYHNQVLQSVSAVNKPDEPSLHPSRPESPQTNRVNSPENVKTTVHERGPDITVEIKSSRKEPEYRTDPSQHKAKTIDELSSVHGSEAHAHAHSDIQSTKFPVSSSVINAGREMHDPLPPVTAEQCSPTPTRQQGEPGANISVPSNTPTPADEHDTV